VPHDRFGGHEPVLVEHGVDAEGGERRGDAGEVVRVVCAELDAADPAVGTLLDVELGAAVHGGQRAVAVVGESEFGVVGDHFGHVRDLVDEGAQPVQRHGASPRSR
jgi:hypothetical protein